MRKSSLGRRSSTHIPVRVPSIGGTSAQRSASGSKKSLLKQPGFSQGRQQRSQSEDRESYGGRPMPSTMLRSSTYGTLPGRTLGTMTPVTPKQSLYNTNLPTSSSVRPTRSQTMSTDSNRRTSSFGGTKNVRKDSRPIAEKAFQQAAQAKVQKYFDVYGSDVIGGPGNSIRPMNTKLFVDMVDHLLKNMDSRIFITKSNYLEELPPLLRKLGYRSKVDRSWLMTVNTPHSWQHVVALLSWLVESEECDNSVDVFEMMYPSNIDEPEEESDEQGEDDINIDKDLILFLKKTYKLQEDPNIDDNVFDRLESEYIEKQIMELKCTDEDFETLQREIDLIQEELDNETQRKDIQLDIVQKLQAKLNAAQSDYQTTEEFIEDSKKFVANTEVQLTALQQEIDLKRTLLQKKQADFEKLQERINSQKISLEDKEKWTKQKSDLHKMIKCYENSIRELDKSAFTVDLKFAEDQRKLEKLIVDYNKLVAEKMIGEPRLKNVEVKCSLLINSEEASLEIVDENLKKLKEEYKSSIHALNSRIEECENILQKVKQDNKETKDEIDKGSSLLKSVECDFLKQQENIEKETQKLKEEHKRYQDLLKEIVEEIENFDQAKLDEKKLEFKKLKHDWNVLEKKIKQLLDGYIEIKREMNSRLEVAVQKVVHEAKELEKNLL